MEGEIHCVHLRAHTSSILLLHVVWDVPYLERSKESVFIHLKGRIWTKPTSVIDEGRYGVWGGGIRNARYRRTTLKNESL